MDMMKFALNIAHMGAHDAHLHLHFHIHLVVQVGFEAIFGRLPILAHQHKNGEKDRLKGHGHREELKGVLIKMHAPWSNSIHPDPDDEGDEIE